MRSNDPSAAAADQLSAPIALPPITLVCRVIAFCTLMLRDATELMMCDRINSLTVITPPSFRCASHSMLITHSCVPFSFLFLGRLRWLLVFLIFTGTNDTAQPCFFTKCRKMFLQPFKPHCAVSTCQLPRTTSKNYFQELKQEISPRI